MDRPPHLRNHLIAAEIVEDLQAALEQFRLIAEVLGESVEESGSSIY